MSDALREWLKVAEPIKGWLFGSAQTCRPFNFRSISKGYLRPAGKRAGITGLRWHTFRHTYRVLLSDMEYPLDVQQALTRHSNIAKATEFSAKRTERIRLANQQVVQLVATIGG